MQWGLAGVELSERGSICARAPCGDRGEFSLGISLVHEGESIWLSTAGACPVSRKSTSLRPAGWAVTIAGTSAHGDHRDDVFGPVVTPTVARERPGLAALYLGADLNGEEAARIVAVVEALLWIPAAVGGESPLFPHLRNVELQTPSSYVAGILTGAYVGDGYGALTETARAAWDAARALLPRRRRASSTCPRSRARTPR